MGEDCGTWLPHMQFGQQSPNLSLFSFPSNAWNQNGISSTAVNSGINFISRNETMPAYGLPSMPNLPLGHSNEPHRWFYCLPRSRQELTRAPNYAAEEKLLADCVKGLRGKFAPYGDSGSPQKQFLVIDQRVDQTTVVYGSKFGSPNECLPSWHSKLHGTNYLNGEFPLETDLTHPNGPIVADKVNENLGTGVESEMHEDTEEINALLYSDSDGYSTGNEDDDDDEVTSTGHSPSTMTTHDNPEKIRVIEEVASSIGRTKKRKLSDGYHDDLQFIGTANSLNLKNKSFAMEQDDAESRCSNCYNGRSEEMESLSANKKMRKEKIRELLNVLQSMIPDGPDKVKDKDPAMLLDDAIRCLKYMKVKAKELGLK
ncbi:hypothetical protein PIB30_053112 [Stylosanthes scabra]|uniref:BHLH domain-containing protein n=1 Tax=Stylosanthes scabra TaxID=79078 RepID=A0ABU6VHY5_9FABA|nr:hypothetical protein [Stylosanthes scabra]